MFVLLAACVTSANILNKPERVEVYKKITERNPIMTHTFGADPCALVYDGRVYIYMTGDTLEYDNKLEIKNNSYSTITELRVASSADLANWVYHEPIDVAGSNGIADWAGRSWAPTITYRKIDGQDTFFLYFSNNANGVGVLTSASPLGPWTDPLGKALVSRQTPNCSGVPWMFDPAVFIDDDGKAYLYFGGGIPDGNTEYPGSARVVELGSDMISLAGEPVKIDVPFFFEAMVMRKINDNYILTYCTNWNVTEEARSRLGINNAVIAAMSGNNPMGPFTLDGTILRNPGTYFGVWGNNHHDLFEFNGQWYIAYHSQILEEAMDIERKGYRVTHIDSINVKNGKFESAAGTKKGVEQVGRLNPYIWQQGATSAVAAEMTFGSFSLPASQEKTEYSSARKNGSWLGVIGADFGSKGAKSITVNARGQTGKCAAEIRLGSPDGETIGAIKINNAAFKNYTVKLKKPVTGTQDIFFMFDSGFVLGGWQFCE